MNPLPKVGTCAYATLPGALNAKWCRCLAISDCEKFVKVIRIRDEVAVGKSSWIKRQDFGIP
jgi:hypothetical protein